MSVFHNNILAGASGAGGAGDATYVDDVFSTFLYDGTGSSLSINNGIDLDGEGGLVWLKSRNGGFDHSLWDTERGTGKGLRSNTNGAQTTASSGGGLTAFNSDGFTLGTSAVAENINNYNYCSWTFRKAPGFFDVVTYTGNGSSTGDSQTISHNLGSTPGFVVIKRTSGTGDWVCWHRSISTGEPRKYLELDSTNGTGNMGADIWGTVSSTEFEVKHNGTVGDSYEINKNGETYVAYFFAHDDQSFGTNSDEAIIKCGTFPGGAGSASFVDLGFEPQFLITKQYDDSGQNWEIADIMRGAGPQSGLDQGKRLYANAGDSEQGYNRFSPTPTGFFHHVSGATNDNFVYIAIRRPNKPPEAGTDVFAVAAAAGNSDVTTSFPVDLAFQLRRSAGSRAALTRLQGKGTLETRNNSAETVNANAWYESNTKFLNAGLFTADSAFHLFKRAPGFMDVVAYTGDGTSSRNVTHSLGSAAKLIIVKRRNTTGNWTVWSEGLTNNYILQLNGTDAEIAVGTGYINSSTSTTFNIGNDSDVNASGSTYIAYLFDTLAGISKVGTYTGSDSTTNVDCGFSSGARFVLIRRFSPQSTTNNWHVFDTARGIVSGNDPFLYLNSNSAENSSNDYIDPLSSGFSLPGGNPEINTSGSTYLFLAIA